MVYFLFFLLGSVEHENFLTKKINEFCGKMISFFQEIFVYLFENVEKMFKPEGTNNLSWAEWSEKM